MTQQEAAIWKLARETVDTLGIVPDPSYHWLMPLELMEDCFDLSDPTVDRKLAGIDVHLEAMLGEAQMVLVHTVANVFVTS